MIGCISLCLFAFGANLAAWLTLRLARARDEREAQERTDAQINRMLGSEVHKWRGFGS